LKFWKFKFSNVHILNFQSFRIPHFWNCECFSSVSNRLLSSHTFYHQLIYIIWVLWKSFVKMSFFIDIIFHFQRSLTKQKLKIGSNGFLIWVSWHSCVWKKNNVPWLPWFQMENKFKKIFCFFWQNLTFNTLYGSFDYDPNVLSPHIDTPKKLTPFLFYTKALVLHLS
jgi:hypothetical protein